MPPKGNSNKGHKRKRAMPEEGLEDAPSMTWKPVETPALLIYSVHVPKDVPNGVSKN